MRLIINNNRCEIILKMFLNLHLLVHLIKNKMISFYYFELF